MDINTEIMDINDEIVDINNEIDDIKCCICYDDSPIRYNKLHNCIDSLICDDCMNLYINRTPLKCPICGIELTYDKKYVVKPLYKLFKLYYYIPIYISVSIILFILYFMSLNHSYKVISNKYETDLNNDYNINNGNCMIVKSDRECLVIKLYNYKNLLLFGLLFVKFPLYYLFDTTIVNIIRYINYNIFISKIYNSLYIVLDCLILIISIFVMNVITITNILFYYFIFVYLTVYIFICIVSMCINIINKVYIIYRNSKYVLIYNDIGVIYKSLFTDNDINDNEVENEDNNIIDVNN